MENAKKIFDLNSVSPMGELLPETIYHYTRFEKLKSILINKSLWLSHIKDTNLPRDSYEFDAGNYFFWGKLYSVPENTRYLKWINTLKEKISKTIRETGNICIFCTCPSSELPSQWGLYGDGGKGVAIGFDTNLMIQLCKDKERDFIIDKCFYTDADKENFWLACFNALPLPFISQNEIREMNELEKTNLLDLLLRAVIIFSAYYKEYCFQWEQEVRILTNPLVKVRENDGKRMYVFDLNGRMRQLIKEIVIGPLANTGITEMKDLLDKHELPNCEVRKSQIDM